MDFQAQLDLRLAIQVRFMPRLHASRVSLSLYLSSRMYACVCVCGCVLQHILLLNLFFIFVRRNNQHKNAAVIQRI